MRNINRVLITGNLSRDPELRRTQSGMPVLGIGVAVNDSKRNPQTGGWEEYTNWIDCAMLGDRAEKIAPMLHKGQKVCIEGKLRYSSWEKEGRKRSKVEVLIDQIEFMSRKDDAPKQEPEPEAGVYDDDIPF